MKKSVLVCIAKDEDHYIEEWLDYNHKLGFDEIIMYENDWTCPVDRPFLKRIKVFGPIAQMVSYNHFINTFGKDYEWAAFFDCDEFLVLKKHKNVNDFFDEFNNENGISVNWVFFGPNGITNRNGNSTLNQFFMRQNGVDKHIKTILKLSSGGQMVNPHCSDISVIDTNRKSVYGPFNYDGPDDVAQLNHYFYKTYEDWVIKCERGRADTYTKRDINEWNNEKFNCCDIEDKTAYNFMYN